MSAPSSNQQKYASRNPVQRWVIERFLNEVVRLVRTVGPRSVLEVGCGEGFVLRRLIDAGITSSMRGVDLSMQAIAQAQSRLDDAAVVAVGDARELADGRESFDLVMMLEVLEHIHEPQQMLPVLDQLSQRHLLLSVPHEPFFRGLNLLRGRHVARLGNHPEHVNLWTRPEFLRFVESRFDIVEAPRTSFPWTLVLARTR